MTGKNEQNTEVITPEKDERWFKLSRPFRFEDNEYTELLLDFEKLTGDDIIAAEREMKLAAGNNFEFIPVLALHVPFQAAIAAKAAGVYVGAINKMSARDFTRVCGLAQGFLLSTD